MLVVLAHPYMYGTSFDTGGAAVTAEIETMTPEQVAEMLGTSGWWVREQARRGRVPHLRFGHGRIVLLPEHVQALIRLVTVETARSAPAVVKAGTADLSALGSTSASVRAHRRRAHVPGDPLF
jgi:hypothetical protein